jgi:hypothetical protein
VLVWITDPDDDQNMWWSERVERRRLRRRMLRYEAAKTKSGKLTAEQRAVTLGALEDEIATRRYERRYQGIQDPGDLKLIPLLSDSAGMGKQRRDFVWRIIHELVSLRETYNERIRRYRLLRTIALGTGAAVPVVASIPTAPRWVIAMLGAIAVFFEGINQVSRPHEQALLQIGLFGNLNRELDDFLNCSGAYVGKNDDDRFTLFVEQVSKLRGETDSALLGVLEQAVKEEKPP